MRKTVSVCGKWINERRRMETEVGCELDERNFVGNMIGSEVNWRVIGECIGKIMGKKI